MSGQPHLLFDKTTELLEKENVSYLVRCAECRVTVSSWWEAATGGREAWGLAGRFL